MSTSVVRTTRACPATQMSERAAIKMRRKSRRLKLLGSKKNLRRSYQGSNARDETSEQCGDRRRCNLPALPPLAYYLRSRHLSQDSMPHASKMAARAACRAAMILPDLPRSLKKVQGPIRLPPANLPLLFENSCDAGWPRPTYPPKALRLTATLDGV